MMESGNERLDKAHDRLLESGWWELEFGESYQPSDEEILATYEELEDDIERYRTPLKQLAPILMRSRRVKFKELDPKAQRKAVGEYIARMDAKSVEGMGLGDLYTTTLTADDVDLFPDSFIRGLMRDLEMKQKDRYTVEGELTVSAGDPMMPEGEELLTALRSYSEEKMRDANMTSDYTDVDEKKLLIAESLAFAETADKLETKLNQRRVKKQLMRFKEKYPTHPLRELLPNEIQLESPVLTDLGYTPDQQILALERMLNIMDDEGVETIDPTFDKINFELWYNQKKNKMGPVKKTDYGTFPMKKKAAGNEWMRWYADADGLDRLMKASERGESYIAYKQPNVRHVGTPNTNLSKANFKFSRTYRDKWGRKRRYVSKSPGKGLVIWNNQELARLAAIRGRANGNWVRTIPVKEGWVNIAAPMKEDEYYVGSKNIPRTSFPSKKNLPKSVRREYFRRD